MYLGMLLLAVTRERMIIASVTGIGIGFFIATGPVFGILYSLFGLEDAPLLTAILAIWEQAASVLDPEELDPARRLFGLSKEGNVREPPQGRPSGNCVLHLAQADALSDPMYPAIRSKLLAAREERVRPMSRVSWTTMRSWPGD